MTPPTLNRKPVRMTVTLPYFVFHEVATRSTQEGRSMSNLVAFLLERALIPQDY